MKVVLVLCVVSLVGCAHRNTVADQKSPPMTEQDWRIEPPRSLQPGEPCLATLDVPEGVQPPSPDHRIAVDADKDGHLDLVESQFAAGDVRKIAWTDQNYDGCLDTRHTVYRLPQMNERHVIEQFTKGVGWSTVREWDASLISH